MGEVVFVDFAGRRTLSREAWLTGATRCEREADRQPDKIADTLRRCAAQYRKQAEGAGA